MLAMKIRLHEEKQHFIHTCGNFFIVLWNRIEHYCYAWPQHIKELPHQKKKKKKKSFSHLLVTDIITSSLLQHGHSFSQVPFIANQIPFAVVTVNYLHRDVQAIILHKCRNLNTIFRADEKNEMDSCLSLWLTWGKYPSLEENSNFNPYWCQIQQHFQIWKKLVWTEEISYFQYWCPEYGKTSGW